MSTEPPSGVRQGPESRESYAEPDGRAPISVRLSRPGVIRSILFAILAGSSLLYYVALSPQRLGRGHDDSIYVTTAKALANGQGYRIISLPYEPAETKYPPFFPFLLSLIWRLYPHFPENLTWMILLSTTATVTFLLMTYRYLVGQRYATTWQALVVVVLVAINWRMVILATSVYSEMLYAVLSLAVLHLAEKYESKQRNWMIEMAIGVLMGVAFLTRSVGIVLPAAVCVYYAMKRDWRRSLVVAVISGLFVIGWLLWSSTSRTPVEVLNVAYYTNYWRDINQVFTSMQANTGLPKVIVIASVIGKNALALILLSVPVVCLGIAYESVLYFGFAFLFVAVGFIKQVRKRLRLLHIYLIFYLVINLPVPYTSYDRYLMPLLPFLLLFLISEVESLWALIRKQMVSREQITNKISAGFIGAALAVAVSIALYNSGSELYWRVASASLKKGTQPSAEDIEAIRWINTNTASSDVLVAYRDAVYYLYTGRKASQSVFLRYGGFVQADESIINERVKSILRIINETHARYLVLSGSDFESEFQPELEREMLTSFVEQNQRIFVPVFKSSDGRSSIYRVENDVTWIGFGVADH